MIQPDMFVVSFFMTEMLHAYTMYFFIRTFFKKQRTDNQMELLSYVAFYFIISISFLLFKIPMLTLILNIVCIFLLTFNYIGDLKKRILVTLFIYTFMFSIELIVVSAAGYFRISLWQRSGFDSILVDENVKIISYVVVRIIHNRWNAPKDKILPIRYWLGIVVIPFCSLSVLLIILSKGQLAQNEMLIVIALILVINVSFFFLYDSVVRVLTEREQRLFYERQNKYYQNQLKLMQDSVERTGKLKHDMKNHLISLKRLDSTQKNDSYDLYYDNLISDLNSHSYAINTGNTIIDGILNYKLMEAEHLNSELSIDLKIPKGIDISDFSQTTIVGNLMDNAIEGLKTIEEGRRLHISAAFEKGVLIFRIKNTYDGKTERKGAVLISRKRDALEHGIGLKSVEEEVDKYHGNLTIEPGEEEFSVTVMLYVD